MFPDYLSVSYDYVEIAKHNLDEKVNGFKKIDRILLKDWTTKVNAILKETKSILPKSID